MARVSTWRKTVVVVPLSHGSSDAPPLIVDMPSAGAGSKAFCDQIAAIDKLRIGKKIGVLAAADLRFLEECVRQVLGL